MSAVLTAQEPSAKYLVNLQPPLVRHFDLIAQAPGGVARLRELILTLAVQGKLVPQDPSDEPASELLKTIRAEKDRLIAEGKIKRDKSLAKIADEEKSFELPVGWEWVRLGQVAARVQYGFTASADHAVAEPKLLRITDIQNNHVNWDTVPGVQIGSQDVSGYFLADGDLLIARTGGTIGKSFLVDVVPVDAIFASYLIRISPLSGLKPKYLKTFASSGHYWAQVYAKSMGTGQPNVNGTALSELVLALPPLSEQSRIVTRVEELMQVCDALEASGQLEAQQHAQLVGTLLATLTQSETPEALADNWQRIATHFDVLLDRPEAVDALEQTILQLAVRGLLVPQDPTDENASVLLQKIRTEKDHLIAQGKIKRDKPLPPLTDDEKPFELPQGWEWIRMGDVIDGGSGTTPLRTRTDYFTNGTEMWVKTTDLTNGLVTGCEELITKAAVAENRLKYFPAGTVCVAMYGGAGTIGKSGVLGVSSTINQSVFALPPTEGIDVNFLHTYVITVRSQWMSFAAGLRKDPNINGQIIKKMVMPLPPFIEQSRIVSRVNELRSLCADLRQRLAAGQAVQSHLADALVAG